MIELQESDDANGHGAQAIRALHPRPTRCSQGADTDLRITGLPAGSYELSIDEDPATKASAEELAQGVNVAIRAGPVTRQAQEVRLAPHQAFH